MPKLRVVSLVLISLCYKIVFKNLRMTLILVTTNWPKVDERWIGLFAGKCFLENFLTCLVTVKTQIKVQYY